MNRKRKALVDRLEESGKEYLQYLAQLDTNEIHGAPAPNEWTIHQVVSHMRDTEQHVFLARTQLIQKETHPAVQSFNQEEWMRERYSPDESFKKIVAEFRAARRKMIALVRKASDQDWANWATHPEYVRISLDWLVMHDYHHTLEHLAQIGYAREKAVLAELRGVR
ncbi:hypothetical protein ANRL3_02502 [Anaerolineae bacterium]|nr:hypothetical protein ANRL3_02502 [Anaerolineae bacterium]